MTKQALLIAAFAMALMALAATTASAYVSLVSESRYGHAGHTQNFSAVLQAGRSYQARLVAPGAYHGGRWEPDMDLYITNPAGRTVRFTRYGNEYVDFRAAHSGRYFFTAVPLYGDGPFQFNLGQNDLMAMRGAY